MLSWPTPSQHPLYYVDLRLEISMLRCQASQPHLGTPPTMLISTWRYRCCSAELANPVDPSAMLFPVALRGPVELVLVLFSFTCHLHTKGRGRFMFTFLALGPLRFV